MSWWQCENCELYHVTHPTECDRCGAVEFTVHEPSLRERLARPSVAITLLGLCLLLVVVYLNWAV